MSEDYDKIQERLGKVKQESHEAEMQQSSVAQSLTTARNRIEESLKSLHDGMRIVTSTSRHIPGLQKFQADHSKKSCALPETVDRNGANGPAIGYANDAYKLGKTPASEKAILGRNPKIVRVSLDQWTLFMAIDSPESQFVRRRYVFR